METTYAQLTDLTSLLKIESPSQATQDYLQRLLNEAGETVDALTRGYRPGYEAFSESASEDRVFDDPRDGVIPIDDAVTITAVAFDGTPLPAGTWQKGPDYNRAPFTQLLIRADSGALYGATYYLPGLVTPYGYGYGVGSRGVARWTITAKWGYCTQAARPAVIGQAALLVAKWSYEQDGVTPQQAMQAIRDPRTAWQRDLKQKLERFKRTEPVVIIYE